MLIFASAITMGLLAGARSTIERTRLLSVLQELAELAPAIVALL
jgi:hypothetical protein